MWYNVVLFFRTRRLNSSFEEIKVHIAAVSMFLLALAVLFGIFEIEAEGKFGWGEKFPTWYRVNGFAAKVYGRLTNKPLTGYHAALFPVPIMMFLWPMVATSTMTLHGALAAFATYFGWVTIWDFSWFILNPHYGIKQFRRGNVWWFGKEYWVLGRLPIGYFIAWFASLGFAAASGYVKNDDWQDALADQAQQLGWYVVGALALILVGAPLFKWYYTRMRQYDERDQAGIKHNES